MFLISLVVFTLYMKIYVRLFELFLYSIEIQWQKCFRAYLFKIALTFQDFDQLFRRRIQGMSIRINLHRVRLKYLNGSYTHLIAFKEMLIIINNFIFLYIWVLVFCYQNCSNLLWEKNCSSDREKLLKFESEGREFAKMLRPLE